MMTLHELELEINELKYRNKKVESDKAWETSWLRRILIFLITYAVIVIYFTFAQLPDPFINSFVPALGFVLSTLTLSYLKGLWLKYLYK